MTRRIANSAAWYWLLVCIMLFTKSAASLNSVRVDCPAMLQAVPQTGYDSVGIPIRITSDITMGGLTLGFSYNSPNPGIKITSASAEEAGTLFAFFQVSNDTSNNRILVGGVAFPPYVAPQNDALFATLWLRVPAGTRPQCLNLDSTLVPPSGVWAFAKATGGKVYPQYIHCVDADIMIATLQCSAKGCGDADLSGEINIADVVCFVRYIFSDGTIPQDASAGDVDCDGSVNIADVVYMINYIFADGAVLCANCYRRPIIHSFEVNPSEVPVGGVCTVVVSASDEDGDSLDYSYLATTGSIVGTGDSVEWIAPQFGGQQDITVYVSDGRYDVQSQAAVDVLPISISGTLTLESGGSLKGARVGIYTNINDWADRAPLRFVDISDTGSVAVYQFLSVPAGNYYIDVWKDDNGNGFIDHGDLYGWYGTGSYPLGQITLFTLSIGEMKTIDMTIGVF